jgi:nucleoside 2-deoxyribosyltransferase
MFGGAMLNTCPVGLSEHARTTHGTIGLDYWVKCPVCGRFEIEIEAWDDYLDPESAVGKKLTAVDRARLAHIVRTAKSSGITGVPRLTSDFLERFTRDGCPGPSPAEQAAKAICYIGDFVSKFGQDLDGLPPDFYVAIGAPSIAMAYSLAFELQKGWVSGRSIEPKHGSPILLSANLTLEGWERYEAEKRGQVARKYGFIAMQFDDDKLDTFVQNVVKPTIKVSIDYDVFDMRDVARARIIDNLMRAQIRDAAFVLVDLTHDNSGAYWEAGYAEGLGKPVIYICERGKFSEARTHFDTNHCTTVLWSEEGDEDFSRELIATLRRSLSQLIPWAE